MSLENSQGYLWIPCEFYSSLANQIMCNIQSALEYWFLASRDECPGSLCHSPSVGVGVRVRVGCVDKNFNLGHNFQTRRGRALILHMCIPCDQTFHMVPQVLTLWPWPWSLTYFWKTLTLAITFLPVEVGLSYCTCVFLVTRPFPWYHSFWPHDLDLEVWPTFEKL